MIAREPGLKPPRFQPVPLPLELGATHKAQDPLDCRPIESSRDDRGGGFLTFDVALQDFVEHLVGWQGVLIGLVRPELGGRRLGQRRCRNDRPAR